MLKYIPCTDSEMFASTILLDARFPLSWLSIRSSIQSINKYAPGSELTILVTSRLSISLLRKTINKKMAPSLSVSWLISSFNSSWGISSLHRSISHLNSGREKSVYFLSRNVLLKEDINTLAQWAEYFDYGSGYSTTVGLIYLRASQEVRQLLAQLTSAEFSCLLRGDLRSSNNLRFLTSAARIGEFPYEMTEKISSGMIWQRLWQIARKKKICAKQADVCILAPRPDLPFKASIHVGTKQKQLERRNEKVRKYWHLFPRLLEATLTSDVRVVERRVLPNWAITPELIKKLPHKMILVPHRDKTEISDPRCLFYMQEVFPDFFTVDKKGWAAGSSFYDSSAYKRHLLRSEIEEFLSLVKVEKLSKFKQVGQSDPIDKFIFLPLQIPHDEVIKRHSVDKFEDITNHVLSWCHRNKVDVIVKKHPFAKNVEYIDKSLLNSPNVHLREDGHVHDYLEKCDAVVVANSGVGFEALIYGKPVVSFARSMYDGVVGSASITKRNFGDILSSVIEECPAERQGRYGQFLNWYFSECGTLLNSDYLQNIQFGRLKLAISSESSFRNWHDVLFEEDPLTFAMNEKIVFGLDDVSVHEAWPSKGI